jgi:hypothetical protein
MKKIAVYAVLLLAVASIAAAACIEMLDEFVPPFYVGVPGSHTLSIYGGTPPYTFSLHSGSFPAGVSMSSSGVISGTATTQGYTTPCIKVTDANGCNTTTCYEIYVF